MKRLILNSSIFAMLSIFMVACAKEDVKPFSGGNVGSTNNVMVERDGDVTPDDPTVDVSSDDPDGITDGGNSSDYDTKGIKKKKQH